MAEDSQAARPGRPPRVIGRYRIEARLGRGGFGEVFAARPVAGTDALAIKLLHPELCHAPDAVARFRREAELLARVEHPGIIRVHEVGVVDDGRPYLVMDRLEGRDLEAHLGEHKQLSIEAAIAILAPLADALETAHAAGVIHRDIKPSNVFLDRRGGGRVVLLDFGIAKLLEPGAGSLTGSMVAIGTPTCMAPEQILGGEITPRTDVYGLASLAFHLVTGEPPFRDPSPTIQQQLHLHARRPRPSARATLPIAIDAPIVRGLDREPRRRQAGPRAFVADLRAAVHTAVVEPPSGRVVAACVHVGAREPGAPVDDAGVAALEEALERVVAALVASGLEVVSDGGDLVLATARDADVRALARACAGPVAAAAAGVAVAVLLHVGTEVDTLAWLPDPLPAGVWASSAALGADEEPRWQRLA